MTDEFDVDASVDVDDPINWDWHLMWEQIFDTMEGEDRA
jgi:hypothetical protein